MNGGIDNSATGNYSSVSGGIRQYFADGESSSVSGGIDKFTTGE